MGQPITLYTKDGDELIVYGEAQMRVELERGALTEKPTAAAEDLPKEESKPQAKSTTKAKGK
jgi:hypothetical protein